MQNTVDCEPSPFLSEIPNELIKLYEKKDEKEADEEQAKKLMAQMKTMFG
jgi:hypothetical protein